jgi:hypothetical protein
VFLDQTALAQRAAAVAASHPRANNQQQQAPHMWCDAVLAPLLELLPELRTALSRGHIPRVLVLNAYNLLHAHPSTKALLQDGLLHRARALLQLVVKEYAAEQHAYVVLVYDAVSLRAPQLTPGARRQRSSSSSSSGSGSAATSGTFTATSSSSGATRRVSVLSGRVSAVYEVGTEADTVIIHLVQELLDREAAAAAAGQLGPASGGPLVSVAVHTNDLRIQVGWLGGWLMAPSYGGGGGLAPLCLAAVVSPLTWPGISSARSIHAGGVQRRVDGSGRAPRPPRAVGGLPQPRAAVQRADACGTEAPPFPARRRRD